MVEGIEPEGGDSETSPGDCPSDDSELFALVYDELRRVAGHEMARQPSEHTLQPTALVNEAWLKLEGSSDGPPSDRRHFMRVAGRVMRQVLVDHARKKAALKRTPDAPQLQQDGLDLLCEEYERRSGGLLGLEEALERLGQRSPDLARLVELRFFAGCSIREAARQLGVSERVAARRWAMVRALLARELGE